MQAAYIGTEYLRTAEVISDIELFPGRDRRVHRALRHVRLRILPWHGLSRNLASDTQALGRKRQHDGTVSVRKAPTFGRKTKFSVYDLCN